MKQKINETAKDPLICVVLTAFNDEESIFHAVEEFISQKNVKKVIVIDNNSVDNTYEIAEKINAKVIKEKKQGYGYAIIRGLKESIKEDVDIVVLAEGDMTFRGRDILKMIPYLEDVDMVIGSRTHRVIVDDASQMDWFYTWGNVLLAKLLELKFFSMRFLSRVRFTDVGCTFRAIKIESLQKIIDKLEVGGHHFSPHMTICALKNGLKVIEIPVTFRKRVGVSKGAGGNKVLAIKVGFRMVWEILTK
ncbi:MAG: glycosyltransferase family 2 protein [Dehalococcoidia bacterium]|nr:MAG: glycosyltransferase family 2 protein [Dehalococcoidia bacterium]